MSKNNRRVNSTQISQNKQPLQKSLNISFRKKKYQ